MNLIDYGVDGVDETKVAQSRYMTSMSIFEHISSPSASKPEFKCDSKFCESLPGETAQELLPNVKSCTQRVSALGLAIRSITDNNPPLYIVWTRLVSRSK